MRSGHHVRYHHTKPNQTTPNQTLLTHTSHSPQMATSSSEHHDDEQILVSGAFDTPGFALASSGLSWFVPPSTAATPEPHVGLRVTPVRHGGGTRCELQTDLPASCCRMATPTFGPRRTTSRCCSSTTGITFVRQSKETLWSKRHLRCDERIPITTTMMMTAMREFSPQQPRQSRLLPPTNSIKQESCCATMTITGSRLALRYGVCTNLNLSLSLSINLTLATTSTQMV